MNLFNIKKNKGFTPTPILKKVTDFFYFRSVLAFQTLTNKKTGGIGVSFANAKRGFTLVEMLVAIGVFMSVMTVSVSALITVIDVNKRNQSIKTVVDNVSFALDEMSRNMRTGSDYRCYQPETNPCQTVVFQPYGYNGNYLYYKFEQEPVSGEGNIQQCDTKISSSCPTSGWQSITAPTDVVNIKSMNFWVFGTGEEAKQPRVLIALSGAALTKTGTSSFELQTTVSQRSR